jgi:D-3-phosphoglycerate dehydrogenase / 2-oxoglutarate reductase
MAKAFRIQTLNKISAKGLARLPGHYEVGDTVADPDGILVRSHNMHDMDIPASVQAIGRAGAGTNNIPVKKLSSAARRYSTRRGPTPTRSRNW